MTSNSELGARGRSGLSTLCLTALLTLNAGCTTTGDVAATGDPLEPTNRGTYDFNETLDRNIFKPVAQTYADATAPEFRTGVTNFFDNLTYLHVLLNDLLQFKLVQFLSDSGRLIVNSTLGVGGLLDPATELGLVKHEEDLGQTFGLWGAEEGAYLVLPLLGPSSVRDAPSIPLRVVLNPLFYIAAPITVPLAALDAVNTRANLLEATDFRDQAALDPYTFVREAYRQRRDYLIHDGNPPTTEFDEFLEDDMFGEDEFEAGRDDGNDGAEVPGEAPALKVY